MNINKNTDLKVLADYFIAYGGCRLISCASCPLYKNVRCDLRVTPGNHNQLSKQWAIEYLEQIKKLEFLEKLK